MAVALGIPGFATFSLARLAFSSSGGVISSVAAVEGLLGALACMFFPEVDRGALAMRFIVGTPRVRPMERSLMSNCHSCGVSISPERLSAVPGTTLCVECKKEAEREAKILRAAVPSTGKASQSEPLRPRRRRRNTWDEGIV
jgi:hypothetical protein